MASRVAITLSLARFAWKVKQMGGATEIASTKAKLNDVQVQAGATMVENMASNLSPIKADTGASGAYQDGRMLKLLVAAGFGIPEQYFGDIGSGNMATAKTVELPMLKMFSSYQAVWGSVYDIMDRLVLQERGITGDVHIDRDFPAIAPSDQTEISTAIKTILDAIPEFADSPDVLSAALMSIGVDDTANVLDELEKKKVERDKEKAANPPPVPPQFQQFQPPAQSHEAAVINALSGYTNQLEVAIAERDFANIWGTLDEETRIAATQAAMKVIKGA